MIRNCLYDKLISFSNLLLASKKALRGKKYKQNISKFLFNLENELLQLHKELKNKTYTPRPYYYFTLKDIKTRTISAADFRDRVVHHAILNVIEDIFEKSFISESYACRKNKGIHKAIKKAQKYINKYQYFMKCDIEKYFDNIDHNVLMDIIKEKITDEDILWLCQVILDNAKLPVSNQFTLTLPLPSRERNKIGIPIGNLTSQFFANVYLDVLDHFIKSFHSFAKSNFTICPSLDSSASKFPSLDRCKPTLFPFLDASSPQSFPSLDGRGVGEGVAYIRYMDDFLIFADNKEDLHIYLAQINKFLSQKLKLKIKEHEIMIAPVSEGVNFLGFRIYKRMIKVKSKNLHRTVRNFHTKLKECQQDKIDLKALESTTQSIIGHLKNANTLQLRKKIFNDIITIKG